MFWEGFADFCVGRDDFMAAFGPASTRADQYEIRAGFRLVHLWLQSGWSYRYEGWVHHR